MARVPLAKAQEPSVLEGPLRGGASGPIAKACVRRSVPTEGERTPGSRESIVEVPPGRTGRIVTRSRANATFVDCRLRSCSIALVPCGGYGLGHGTAVGSRDDHPPEEAATEQDDAVPSPRFPHREETAPLARAGAWSSQARESASLSGVPRSVEGRLTRRGSGFVRVEPVGRSSVVPSVSEVSGLASSSSRTGLAVAAGKASRRPPHATRGLERRSHPSEERRCLPPRGRANVPPGGRERRSSVDATPTGGVEGSLD